MFCIVLYCIVMWYIISYCILLYCIVFAGVTFYFWLHIRFIPGAPVLSVSESNRRKLWTLLMLLSAQHFSSVCSRRNNGKMVDNMISRQTNKLFSIGRYGAISMFGFISIFYSYLKNIYSKFNNFSSTDNCTNTLGLSRWIQPQQFRCVKIFFHLNHTFKLYLQWLVVDSEFLSVF